jgi:hypothetical protein
MEGNHMKYFLILLLVIVIPSSAARLECVKWSWTGDVYNRVVTCLEWRDKDAPPKKEKK